MHNLKLRCQCGQVQGTIHNVTPSSGNRLTCYCKDCRQFAEMCSNELEILNAQGGMEVYQVAPASVTIEKGIENIGCVRLTKRGIFRWYTTCCHTPIANTPKPKVPFVGLIHSIIDRQDFEQKAGPNRGDAYPEQAINNQDNVISESKTRKILIFRMLAKLASYKLTGKGLPNPFFDQNQRPIVKPSIGQLR